ncbi:MAG: hypothetical protein QOI61_326 [Actinomycetota bacterium]
MGLDPSRRAQLNLAKLKVLAKSAGADGLTPLGFPGGAAASGDGTLWVLGDDLGTGLLGPSLAVALRAAYDRLVVITDDPTDAGVLARRASYFAQPATIDAASVDGTTLAISTRFAPREGAKRVPVAGFEVPAGVDVVHEHGVTSFEVRGLEIGRIENGELAVGVGKHDREGHRMANPDQDPVEALQAVAARVLAERTADAPGGLMTSVGRERWLRSIVCAHPELVGAAKLTAVAPPLPRDDLRVMSIAPAVGDGMVVACSVGVYPDLVPSAADARAMYSPDAELVLVVPEADAIATTHRLAAALRAPARIVTVPANWAAMGD